MIVFTKCVSSFWSLVPHPDGFLQAAKTLKELRSICEEAEGVCAMAWLTSVELDEFGSGCSVPGVCGAVECGVASEAMVGGGLRLEM